MPGLRAVPDLRDSCDLVPSGLSMAHSLESFPEEKGAIIATFTDAERHHAGGVNDSPCHVRLTGSSVLPVWRSPTAPVEPLLFAGRPWSRQWGRYANKAHEGKRPTDDPVCTCKPAGQFCGTAPVPVPWSWLWTNADSKIGCRLSPLVQRVLSVQGRNVHCQ